MSALRIGRPGIPVEVVPIDDGAVARVYGQSRGGMIVIGGTFVTGTSERDMDLNAAARYREANREAVRAKAHAYYVANKARILEAQRRRRAK